MVGVPRDKINVGHITYNYIEIINKFQEVWCGREDSNFHGG